MNKKQIQNILIEKGIEQNEACAEAELILEEIYNKTKEQLIFYDEFDEKKIMPVLQKRLQTRMPIQYILGSAYFMSKKFYVNKSVLIPRDETELLVREAYSACKPNMHILDIGTGSGIIACMLGLLGNDLNINVLAVDISTAAINVALLNMKKYNLQGVCVFRKSDIFSNIKQDEKFDIIVSNPPYIPKKLKPSLQKEVLYEPGEALFTDDEKGLYFYEKIIFTAPEYLKKGGYVFFEVMQGQSEDVIELFNKNNYKNVQQFFDMANIPRVIKAQYF